MERNARENLIARCEMKTCYTDVEMRSGRLETEGRRRNGNQRNLSACVRGDEPALVPGKRGLATFAVGMVDLESHGGDGLAGGASSLARVGDTVQVWLAHDAGVVHVAESGRGLARRHVGGEVVTRLRGRGRRRRRRRRRRRVARRGRGTGGGGARRVGARAGVRVLADEGLDLLKKVR